MPTPRFGMEVESSYREIQASWGIAIDLSGSLRVDVEGKCEKISLQILPNSALTEEEISFLERGLERSLPWMESVCPDTRFLVVLSSVRFSLCDFQPEGLEVAILKWASEACGFAMPPVSVNFNKVIRKYEFGYP